MVHTFIERFFAMVVCNAAVVVFRCHVHVYAGHIHNLSVPCLLTIHRHVIRVTHWTIVDYIYYGYCIYVYSINSTLYVRLQVDNTVYILYCIVDTCRRACSHSYQIFVLGVVVTLIYIILHMYQLCLQDPNHLLQCYLSEPLRLEHIRRTGMISVSQKHRQ